MLHIEMSGQPVNYEIRTILSPDISQWVKFAESDNSQLVDLQVTEKCPTLQINQLSLRIVRPCKFHQLRNVGTENCLYPVNYTVIIVNTMKSFNFVVTKFCGLMTMNMFVDTWIRGFQLFIKHYKRE